MLSWNRQNGQNALPVINTATHDLLKKFSHDLKKQVGSHHNKPIVVIDVVSLASQVVLCNQSLFDILVRSGKVQTADSLLDQHKVSQQVKTPLAKLNDDEVV